MGAFYNATKILIGTPNTQKGFFFDAIQRNKLVQTEGGKRNHFEYNYKTVIKYNSRYAKYIEGEKRRMGETSDEFEMAYNLRWMLERGMFIDSVGFDKLKDDYLGLSLMDTKNVHVAGIDFGKKSDSTVVTILEVDWDNPVIVESSEDLNTPDYIAYNVYIKAWLEIQGDNWEEQYHIIKDFLNNFRMARIVVDSTGVGDPIYDRMRANFDCEVLPYVFSKHSKSALYKHLGVEFRAIRVHYPSDEETQETPEFQRFSQQFLDLEKSYSGQLLIVEHPDVKGAHDDYSDSLALAVWGAKGEGVEKPQTEKESIYQKAPKAFTTSRNQITARRR